MLIAMTTATVYEITLKTEGQCGNSQISLYQQLKIIWDRERRQAKLDSECWERVCLKKNKRTVMIYNATSIIKYFLDI